MKGISMQPKSRKPRPKQSGFTLIEMLIATVIMVAGLVGVAQLVPLSIRLNAGNRNDSTALVLAQRELDAMIDQPISLTAPQGFQDPNGLLCPANTTCLLGDSTQPKVAIGSPVVMFNNSPVIDFSQAPVAGYGFNYTDPNDPFGSSYDVRWAVITYANGGNAAGKRFIVGVRRRGGNTPFLPVTLDTMVEK